jgi:hypothetical protein
VGGETIEEKRLDAGPWIFLEERVDDVTIVS